MLILHLVITTKEFKRKMVFFSYPSFLTYVLGAQKNSIHNIFLFEKEKKIFFVTHSYLKACKLRNVLNEHELLNIWAKNVYGSPTKLCRCDEQRR